MRLMYIPHLYANENYHVLFTGLYPVVGRSRKEFVCIHTLVNGQVTTPDRGCHQGMWLFGQTPQTSRPVTLLFASQLGWDYEFTFIYEPCHDHQVVERVLRANTKRKTLT